MRTELNTNQAHTNDALTRSARERWDAMTLTVAMAATAALVALTGCSSSAGTATDEAPSTADLVLADMPTTTAGATLSLPTVVVDAFELPAGLVAVVPRDDQTRSTFDPPPLGCSPVALMTDLAFDSNRWEIKEEGAGSLRSFADAMGALDGLLGRSVVIEVHGHTDRQPTGLEGGNQRLSELRAEAVRDALVAVGMDPVRFVVEGHADSQPWAGITIDTPEQRAQNRRVELWPQC